MSRSAFSLISCLTHPSTSANFSRQFVIHRQSFIPCIHQVNPSKTPQRYFATHSEYRPNENSGSKASSSDLLDRLDAEARSRNTGSTLGDGRETVGPFPLGVGPSGRKKGWKPWSQLGIGGKVARTTAQTGNLTVIIIGGSLFLILTFALTTELFAKNSPSVLYSQAVEMIRSSDALNPHLLPPLTFTHSPNPTAPSRGSQPLAHRLVKHPTSGRDHLLLTFFVHGRGRDEPDTSISGYLSRTWTWIDGTVRAGAELVGIGSSGDDIANNEETNSVVPEPHEQSGSSSTIEKAGLSRLFGSFTSLRSSASSTRSSTVRGPPPPGTYKLAEVRADYVKNAAGHFTLLAMVVDVPTSRAPHPSRSTIFWSPEADTEGLLGRRPR